MPAPMTTRGSIVLVTVAIDPKTDAIDPSAPFMVTAQEPGRSGLYFNEPEVIAQLFDGESEAKFYAEWTAAGWKFGKRFADA